MAKHGRTGAVTLLVVVLFAALGLLLSNASDSAAALPDPIDVSLDFDQLVPGVAQVRTYPLTVPSHARVADAGIVRATGIAAHIDWTFELCRSGTCGPLEAGQTVESGSYTLQVSAMLGSADADASGTGQVVGGVQFEQAPNDPTDGWTPIHTMIAVAACAVAAGALLTVTMLRREGGG